MSRLQSLAPPLLVALLAVSGARAAVDVVQIARHDHAWAPLALFLPALLGAAAAHLPALVLAAAAMLVLGRGPIRPAAAIAVFAGVAAAVWISSEEWLRAVEALNLPPFPPSRALFRPAATRALAFLAGGCVLLVPALFLVAKRVPDVVGSVRMASALAVIVALLGLGSLVAHGLARRHDAPLAIDLAPGSTAPPNILLIVLDTVRADRIASYGLPLDTTPEIDRLAAEGTTFVNAISPAPWTLPAHASLFTGLYPSEHGAHYGHMRLDESATTLAEVLSAVGYDTAGFSKKTWLSREMGTTQGFRTYRDLRFREPSQRLFFHRLRASIREIFKGRPLAHADAGGEAIGEAAADWIHSRGPRAVQGGSARTAGDSRAPFFVFINFNEAHLPFVPSRPFFLRYARRIPNAEVMAANIDAMNYIAGAVRLSEDDLGLLRALYAGEIAYIDRQIARVVSAVDAIGAGNETIVIVTSDHGENIGDHGLMGHVLCVYDTLLRIPLVIRYPKAFRPGTIDERTVQLTDLFPTLAELAGPDAQMILPRTSGKSLLSSEPRGFAVSEYQRPDDYLDRYPKRFPAFDTTPYRRDLFSLLAGDFKYIEGSDGRRELYDLAADPSESSDLSKSSAARAMELAAVLARFREGLARRAEGGTAPELDKETLEELRSLGYVR